MSHLSLAWLVIGAWCQLARFDAVCALRGHADLRPRSRAASTLPPTPESQSDLLRAMVIACSLYWKRVRCLQRATATVRLLRAHHVDASLVIGYRRKPFVSHAWVEIDGQVVNDSPAYARRLSVLYVG
jgi:hypothetical protein